MKVSFYSVTAKVRLEDLGFLEFFTGQEGVTWCLIGPSDWFPINETFKQPEISKNIKLDYFAIVLQMSNIEAETDALLKKKNNILSFDVNFFLIFVFIKVNRHTRKPASRN